MKKIYPFFAFLIFNTVSLISYSQDVHFSQYQQTPSLVNPALTGALHVLRASVIYRDQWRNVTVPYKTYGASVEMKLHAIKLSSMAAGLSFYNDKAGDGNMGTSQVNLSLATFILINQKNLLTGGLQASVVQHTLDFSKLVFPDQYNGGSYDPNINNGENVSSQNYIYPDFAGGINWASGNNKKTIGGNKYFKSNVGASIYHINRPRQKFLTGSNDKLNMKFVLHGDFVIGTLTNITFVPSYLIQFQGPSKEIVLGMMCKYYFKEDSKYTGNIKQSAFGLGAAFRNKDALIISASIEQGQYAIGYSYDLNTSRLKTASAGRGGSEIFIRFVTPNPFSTGGSAPKAKYNLK